MRAPALVRQVRARLTGYFWLPCTACGHWFAGYEDHGPGVMGSRGSGWTTCSRPECVTELEKAVWAYDPAFLETLMKITPDIRNRGSGPYGYDYLVDANWATEVAAGNGTEGQQFSTFHGHTFKVYSTIQRNARHDSEGARSSWR
ncbi:hypothetical protein LCGC14_1337670 [marine sediment metagenome]|uniref:Uncharacterized protein n=1 Tax=marine sediment metagenome TaxID=412755 RepID=A0A0F9KFD9_9ZZZZ